jgi:hypothetical protein
MQQPLVNKKYMLKRFQAKGGWTYVIISEIEKNKNAPFGMVRVCGFIDDYEIKGYNLMPIKNGHLFLPVKAAIRKQIGKKEGDYVQVILYPDNLPTEIPEELQLCFSDEPKAYTTFLSYSSAEQKAFIDWIYSAKKEETKIERIAVTITKLQRGQKFTDKDK